MKRETRKKIESCKALQGKTVEDLIMEQKFLDNLAAYWKAQKEERLATRKSYAAMRKLGNRTSFLPAHTIDHLIDLTTEQLRDEFLSLFRRDSKRSAAERKYIEQIGTQAYNLTICQYAIEEFPELKHELLPDLKNAN